MSRSATTAETPPLLRGQASNPDFLGQGQAWFQFHHLALVWTGGLVPLPLGYVSVVDRAGVEPATFSLQGSCATWLRHRPGVAGAGIEPAKRGVWAPADPRSPAAMDGVADRTLTAWRGSRPGVSSTSTSATVDEEGLEPSASSV